MREVLCHSILQMKKLRYRQGYMVSRVWPQAESRELSLLALLHCGNEVKADWVCLHRDSNTCMNNLIYWKILFFFNVSVWGFLTHSLISFNVPCFMAFERPFPVFLASFWPFFSFSLMWYSLSSEAFLGPPGGGAPWGSHGSLPTPFVWRSLLDGRITFYLFLPQLDWITWGLGLFILFIPCVGFIFVAQWSSDTSRCLNGRWYVSDVTLHVLIALLIHRHLKYREKRESNTWYNTLVDWVPVRTKGVIILDLGQQDDFWRGWAVGLVFMEVWRLSWQRG